MKVLVTGGTGFVGSNLTLELLRAGHDVAITGNEAEQKLPGFTGKLFQPGFLGIDWDAIGNVDVLFHQAAINDTTSRDEREMFRANVEAPRSLFEYAIGHGCRKIVYASSTAVYGNAPAPYREDGPTHPLNAYARSKLAFDTWAMEFARTHPDLTVVGLRYCNVYGPREGHKGSRASMVFQLARQMRTGNPRLFKHGEQKRDYLYVADAVRANLLAAEAAASRIVNCGSGRATTFNRLVELLNAALGTRRTPEYVDNPFAEVYQSYTECDMTKAKEVIGFVPAFDIERGIAAYAKSGFLG
jgi:ADP-L-glycero-D-manno-heptose 6-epimerase